MPPATNPYQALIPCWLLHRGGRRGHWHRRRHVRALHRHRLVPRQEELRLLWRQRVRVRVRLREQPRTTTAATTPVGPHGGEG